MKGTNDPATLLIDDILSMEGSFRRNFVNSLTGFKSVALVGTINAKGEHNLAIFSQIIHVGASPPYLGVLFRPHTVTRNTFENILETGSFTVNHILSGFAQAAHQTSARYTGSEFEATGLTPEFSAHVKAPYVKESTIKMGLELVEVQKINANDTELVIGAIKEVTIPARFVGNDGFIDLEAAGTITCSGLDSYHSTGKLVRLSYAKPGTQPTPL